MKSTRTILSVLLQTTAALVVAGCAQSGPADRIPRTACDRPLCRIDPPADAHCADAMVTDDTGVKRQLEHAAHKLMEAGKCTPVADLAKQLSRTQCKLTLGPPQPKAMTAAQTYARCRGGVLVVAGLYKCPKCTRWHVSPASGILVHPSGIFLTNYHVMKNTKYKAMVAMTADGKVYPVTEILAASASEDVAVVRLDAGGRRLAALPISVGSPVGSPVTVISHPVGRFYLLTAGIVSRYQKTKRAGKTVSMMTITADFARGSSGAPVLNDRGAVIGMVASTSSVYYPALKKGKAEQLQMVFKQCVPAESIVKLFAAP